MRHNAASKWHSAEKYHPKHYGLKKQSNKKSFIENPNIWHKTFGPLQICRVKTDPLILIIRYSA
jgi:hypothetical protein